MSEQTVTAAPSAAQGIPVLDVARGPLVNMTAEQRQEFRSTGKMPEPPKKIEVSAPSGTVEEPISEAEDVSEAETAGEPEPPKSSQEHTRRKPGAEQRIAQLTSEKKRLEAELQALKTPKQETKPVQQQPQNYQEWRKSFKPSQWIEGYSKENPEASYEDATAAMADFLGDVRDQFRMREQQETALARDFAAKVEQARARYENFEEIVEPTAGAINDDQAISPVVKQMLRESDVFPDLIFTIGSNAEELANFQRMARTNPGKALRYIALTESLINEELGKAKAPALEEPPARPKTQAPRPPQEAGGRAAAPPDSLEAALESSGGKLTASLKAEFARRALAKLKG